MQGIYRIFTLEEIKAVDVFKEGCQGVSANGNEIICFDILSDILHERKELNKLPRETLLLVYAQLKSYKQTWSSIIWLDSQVLDKLFPKLRHLLKDELDGRK